VRVRIADAGPIRYLGIVGGTVVVTGGIVGGTLLVVAGTVVVGASVVVVAGGVVVAGVVVSTGGGLVAGGLVAGGLVAGGLVAVGRCWVVAVVTPGRLVVAVVGAGSPGGDATVLAGTSVLEVGTVTVVIGGRATVVVGAVVDAWVATCCLAAPPEPVATSKRSPSMARDARA